MAPGGSYYGRSLPASPVYAVMRPAVRGRKESFGPIVAVMRVPNEAEAVCVANDTEYGLSGAMFSGDGARGLRVANRIRSGICHVNGPTVHDEAQRPFGGIKDSGYGRFSGQADIAEFTDLRWMTLQTGERHDLI